ncbi:hypothetical protein THAOC_21925 [Thalassiosira oceanica]|uniref:Uncharacterized protein n=1 Tax=Thalassiosira oceanica TaxID=159749 RepID=K0RY88_THAOC|nr:hypothetical protein THAOC_21925 [Thalassiosira oceanica]|eukprot:EJK57985.1 hypothetical protein THAOC_21925 [Thalassiosira oceanica]
MAPYRPRTGEKMVRSRCLAALSLARFRQASLRLNSRFVPPSLKARRPRRPGAGEDTEEAPVQAASETQAESPDAALAVLALDCREDETTVSLVLRRFKSSVAVDREVHPTLILREETSIERTYAERSPRE